ncbi:MAG: DUF6077 domain-containing protein [Lachnospiraceae bacterium]|nr:DUF6077 domain-containing protein [Lachnospiraceae bacterium]
MVQIFCGAVLILFICNLTGQLWVNRWEAYRDSLWMATLMGLVTLFAAFQVVAVPAIFMKAKLHVLVIYMAAVMIVLSVLSLIQIVRSRGAYYVHQLEKLRRALKDKGNVWLLLAAVLILYQTWYATSHDALNGDDTRYVCAIVDAVETDEMLMYHPATGEYLGEIVSEFKKDAMAPVLMFWAMWAKLLGVHGGAFAHTLVPLFMVPLAYGAAFLLGYKLCGKDNRWTGMFLCVYCLFNLVNHTLPIEGIGKTIYYMRWGKSILYCLLIPFVILLLMEVMDAKKAGQTYVRLGVTLLGGCMASTMSCIFLPFLTGVWAVWDGIRAKSFRRFLIPILLCIPALCYGLFYYSL